MQEIKEIFTNIYETNYWKNGSGPGSLPSITLTYRKLVEEFIIKNNIKSVLDYGCGDYQFSKLIPWADLDVNYLGVDVVKHIIDQNQEKYSNETINFQTLDSFEWKTFDLILCKDVLQHLPNKEIHKLLNKMTSRATYIMITNDLDILNPNKKRKKRSKNTDISIGDGRLLDLELPPFEIKSETLLVWPGKNFIKKTILINN